MSGVQVVTQGLFDDPDRSPRWNGRMLVLHLVPCRRSKSGKIESWGPAPADRAFFQEIVNEYRLSPAPIPGSPPCPHHDDCLVSIWIPDPDSAARWSIRIAERDELRREAVPS